MEWEAAVLLRIGYVTVMVPLKLYQTSIMFGDQFSSTDSYYRTCQDWPKAL